MELFSKWLPGPGLQHNFDFLITHHPTLESDQDFCPAHCSNGDQSIGLRACCVKWSTSNLEMVNVHLNHAIEENCSPTHSSFQSRSSETERDLTRDKVSRHLNCNYRRANRTQVSLSEIHFKKKIVPPLGNLTLVACEESDHRLSPE